jgi:hypothetical protein
VAGRPGHTARGADRRGLRLCVLGQLAGFASFAACFALITLVWYYHYRLFSRFDMDDGWTIVLNSLLLFVVLFYVYPLKFIFAIVFQFTRGSTEMFSDVRTQLPWVMSIYAAGYIAVFLVFSLMYLHAYRRRHELQLTDDDVLYAYEHIVTCIVMCVVGVLSIVVAHAVPWQWSGLLAGITYGLIGPFQMLAHAKWTRPRRARLLAASQIRS